MGQTIATSTIPRLQNVQIEWVSIWLFVSLAKHFHTVALVLLKLLKCQVFLIHLHVFGDQEQFSNSIFLSVHFSKGGGGYHVKSSSIINSVIHYIICFFFFLQVTQAITILGTSGINPYNILATCAGFSPQKSNGTKFFRTTPEMEIMFRGTRIEEKLHKVRGWSLAGGVTSSKCKHFKPYQIIGLLLKQLYQKLECC